MGTSLLLVESDVPCRVISYFQIAKPGFLLTKQTTAWSHGLETNAVVSTHT